MGCLHLACGLSVIAIPKIVYNVHLPRCLLISVAMSREVMPSSSLTNAINHVGKPFREERAFAIVFMLDKGGLTKTQKAGAFAAQAYFL